MAVSRVNGGSGGFVSIGFFKITKGAMLKAVGIFVIEAVLSWLFVTASFWQKNNIESNVPILTFLRFLLLHLCTNNVHVCTTIYQTRPTWDLNRNSLSE